MPIFHGQNEIAELNVGGEVIAEVYAGADLVWAGASPISALITPVMSPLYDGQTVGDVTDYDNMIAAVNFVSSAGTIDAPPVVSFQGDAASSVDPLAETETGGFTVTVTDSVGNVQSFVADPIVVQYKARVVSTIGNEADIDINPIVPDGENISITISGGTPYDGVYVQTAGELRQDIFNFADTVDITFAGDEADLVEGSTLTGDDGLWSLGGSGLSLTVTRRWMRDVVPIAGAIDPTYDLIADDGGTNITLEATGSDGVNTPVIATGGSVSPPSFVGGGDAPVLITPSPLLGTSTVSLDISSVPDGEKVYFLIGATMNAYGNITSVKFDGNDATILVSGNTEGPTDMRVETVIAEHAKIASDSGPLTLAVSGTQGVTGIAVMAVQADGWETNNIDGTSGDATGTLSVTVTATNPGALFAVATDRGGGGSNSVNFTTLPAGVTQVALVPISGTYDAVFAVGSTSSSGPETVTATVDDGAPDMSIAAVALNP